MRKAAVFVATVAALVIASAPVSIAAVATDQKTADGAVLKDAEVPSLFTGGPVRRPPPSDNQDACKGAIATADKTATAAPHARSVFQLPPIDGFGVIDNAVSVLPTVAKAKSVMAAYRNDTRAKACLEARFQEVFAATGVTVSVTLSRFDPSTNDKGNEKVIKGGDEFAGYAAGIRRAAGDAPQFYEAQVVLARKGRAATQFVFIADGVIPRDDVQQMMQAVINRL